MSDCFKTVNNKHFGCPPRMQMEDISLIIDQTATLTILSDR